MNQDTCLPDTKCGIKLVCKTGLFCLKQFCSFRTMEFVQPVTTARFRSNSLLSSLPSNIINEILQVVNEEISGKINT